MAQYIDKNALVAEINNRLEELWDLIPNASKVENDNLTTSESCALGKYTSLESIRDYINTLEMKEVDSNEKCKDLNDDGTCIYAANKTGKIMRCENINCSRKIKAQKGE